MKTIYTLFLLLAGCDAPPAKNEDCTVLSEQRQREIRQIMADFKAGDVNSNPSFKGSEKFLDLRAKLERVENIYHAKCPEKTNAPNN